MGSSFRGSSQEGFEPIIKEDRSCEEYSGYVGLDRTQGGDLASVGEHGSVQARIAGCDRQHEEINSEIWCIASRERGEVLEILLRGGTVWIRSLPLD